MADILWIDDNDYMTRDAVEILKENEHHVTWWLSWSSDTLIKDNYDLVVLDLAFPVSDADGVSLDLVRGVVYLKEMLDTNPALRLRMENGETKCLFLSRHLANPNVREEIRVSSENRSIRAFLRAKKASSAAQEDAPAKVIASTIQSILEIRDSPLLSEEMNRRAEAVDELDFFTIELADFRSLDDDVQVGLRR